MRACMCARRLTRPSSMTMPSTSARASGLLLWSFRRRLALLPLADISTGSATLQRSSFAVLGACGGHPKTRRCARPARWSTGRLRRIAELLTRGSVIVGRRCDQPRPGPPGVRAERLAPVRARLVCWRDTPRLGRRCPAPQARGRASPGPARHEHGMPQQSGPVRLVSHAESRHADGGVWLVVRQDGNHLEFEWEDAPGSGRSLRSVFRRSPRYVRDSVLLSAGTALHACRDRVGCCRWSDTERRAGARDRHRPAPGYHLVVDIDVDQGVCSEAGSFPIRSMNASQRAWRLAFRQAAGRRLTASRVDARPAALMPANPPGRSRLPAGKT